MTKYNFGSDAKSEVALNRWEIKYSCVFPLPWDIWPKYQGSGTRFKLNLFILVGHSPQSS